MDDGMSGAAAEKGAMQVDVLQWCGRLMLHHETKASVKGKNRP